MLSHTYMHEKPKLGMSLCSLRSKINSTVGTQDVIVDHRVSSQFQPSNIFAIILNPTGIFYVNRRYHYFVLVWVECISTKYHLLFRLSVPHAIQKSALHVIHEGRR